VTLTQGIVAAALAVLGYFAVYVLKSLKGISRKLNKVVGFLIRSDDLNPEKRREQLTHIIEGK
jgi:hypothetical protein